jgi:menaquinone-dependent protoporphyrinogen IX oxidase
MNPILVVYTPREGQPRRIAEHVAAKLKRQGLSVNLLEGGHVPAGSPSYARWATSWADARQNGSH